jgi:hypothetical protein
MNDVFSGVLKCCILILLMRLYSGVCDDVMMIYDQLLAYLFSVLFNQDCTAVWRTLSRVCNASRHAWSCECYIANNMKRVIRNKAVKRSR